MTTLESIKDTVKLNEQKHMQRLESALKASFGSLESFQDWIAAEMKSIGMDVDEFYVEMSELYDQPANQKVLREDPDSLRKAKNVVGKIPGQGPRQGMLLFGHADKRPETFEWAKKHPEMTEVDGRLYGPGIADDVSGITAMLSAVETYLELGLKPKGDTLVASILGKQMGIFGTYGLIKRYGPLDAAIYLHPAESGDGLGELKMSSLGSIEFIINVDGKSPDFTDPHQTIFSKTAVSGLDKGMYLVDGLQKWASVQSEKYPHPRIAELAGQTFAMSIGKFNAGMNNETYHIAKDCKFQGHVVFPPNAKLDVVRDDFRKAFDSLVAADPWLSQGHAKLEWGDCIDQSCQSDEDHPFMKMAAKAIKDVTGKNPSMYYGHTTSDIRYPLLYWNAQAFGVGPLSGDLAKESEWVEKKEYLETIIAVTEMLKNAA